jgi:hypothetical protein
MRNAQTPCPIKGLIGDEALEYYSNNPEFVPVAPVITTKDSECTGKRLRYDSFKKRHIYDNDCDKQ